MYLAYLRPQLQVKVEVLEGFTEEDLQAAVECLVSLKKTLSHFQHQLPYEFRGDSIVLENSDEQTVDFDYVNCDGRSTEKFSNDDLRIVEQNLENIKKKLEYLRRWLKVNESCEYCQAHDVDTCPKHGSVISNDQVSNANDISESQALPDGLYIKKSELKVSGNGVWTDIPFSKGVRFGPYQGVQFDGLEAGSENGYCWEQVLRNKEPVGYVDGKDESCSNWLRNVNCACDEEHQNLLAFYCGGHVSYCTYKAIQAGTELLVWYSQSYAMDAGLCKTDVSKAVGCNQYGGHIEHRVTRKTLHQHLKKEKRAEKPNQCAEVNGNFSSGWSPLEIQELASADEYFSALFGQIFADDNVGIRRQDGSGELSRLSNNSARSFDFHQDPEPRLPYNRRDCPHQCSYCPKSFRQRCRLLEHMRTHTGEKPYRCSQCDKCYGQSSELREHVIRRHTRVFPHKCAKCRKGFVRPYELRRHLRKHGIVHADGVD